MINFFRATVRIAFHALALDLSNSTTATRGFPVLFGQEGKGQDAAKVFLFIRMDLAYHVDTSLIKAVVHKLLCHIKVDIWPSS